MNTKNLLIVGTLLVIVALALWGLPTSNPTNNQEVDLQSDLSDLDSTDLDSEFDSEMQQLTSDSSTF